MIMPRVYLAVDKWTGWAPKLYDLGWRSFFATTLNAVSTIRRLPDIDAIIDNGAYHRGGRPDFSLALFAAKNTRFRYIMPDVMNNPQKTLELHLLFARSVSEEELKRGFAVLQCWHLSVDRCMQQFDEMRAHGLVNGQVAVAINPEIIRSRITKLFLRVLYTELKRYDVYVHALGMTTCYADSYDTSSWGWRLLDQRLNGEKYDLTKIIQISGYDNCGGRH